MTKESMTFTYDLVEYQFDQGIKDYILTKIKELDYYEDFVDYSDVPIDVFVMDMFEQYIDGKTLIETFTIFRDNKFNRSKKRWLASLKKSFEIGKKPIAANNYLQHYKNILIETLEFQNLKKSEEAKELEAINEKIEKKLQDVEHWAADEQSYLSEFPFILRLTNNRRLFAFQIDVTYTMFNALIEIVEQKNSNVEVHSTEDSFIIPRSMPSIVEATLKKEAFVQEVDEKTGDYLYKWTYKTTDGYSLTYMHDKAYLSWLGLLEESSNGKIINEKLDIVTKNNKDNMMVKLPFFDLEDYEILGALLNYQTTSFVMNKPITAKTRDLVMGIYNNDSQYHYNNLYNRLKKMQSLKGVEEIIDKETGSKSTRIFQFLSSLEIVEPANQPAYVLVSFDEKYRDNYLNEQTYRIYKKQLSAVEKDTKKMIIYLQKLRFDLFTKDKVEQFNSPHKNDQLVITHFDFLRNVKIDLKQKKRQKELIIKSLQELVDKEIMVKSFINEKDKYLLTFYPLDEMEINDIFSNGDAISAMPLLTPRIEV